MRWILVAATVATMVAGPGIAACSDSVLTVESWSAEPLNSDQTFGPVMTLTVKIRSNAKAPIRMIDGSVRFADVLGGRINSYSIPRDVQLVPGGEFEAAEKWGQFTFERLLDLRPEDVVANTCIDSILYEDGTIERF